MSSVIGSAVIDVTPDYVAAIVAAITGAVTIAVVALRRRRAVTPSRNTPGWAGRRAGSRESPSGQLLGNVAVGGVFVGRRRGPGALSVYAVAASGGGTI
jgi:hypothetical protein